jgi:hypothetical protein
MYKEMNSATPAKADGCPPKKTMVFQYMLPEKTGRRRSIRTEGDAFLDGALPCLVDGPGAHQASCLQTRGSLPYQHWTMEPEGHHTTLCQGPPTILDFIVLLLHGLLLARKV